MTGVRKRDVIISKLAYAMQGVLEESADLGITMDVLEAKAAEIEQHLERDFASNPHAHKTKFLQILRNLRDENNSQLRLRVAVGHLEVSDFMSMSAIELAPEQVRNLGMSCLKIVADLLQGPTSNQGSGGLQ